MAKIPVLMINLNLLRNAVNHAGYPLRHVRSTTSSLRRDGKPKYDDNNDDANYNRQHARAKATLAELVVQTAPQKIKPYLHLIRLDKPIGSWLLYLPCTWSIALAAEAGAWPDLHLLTLFGVGAVCMRGAGCTINDMWDKDIDSKVERTMARPIASGQITHRNALIFLAGQLSAGLFILLQLNWYCVGLGVLSMGLVTSYPLMKRYIDWPQMVLGMAFNWGALMGYAAVQGACDWAICLPLYVAGISWTMIYDTIYAHQDRHDDLLIGMKSTAIAFGHETGRWMKAFTWTMLSSLMVVGVTSHQIWPYYLSVGAIATQQFCQIVSLDIDDKERCYRQFRAQKYTGMLLLLGIVSSRLMTTTKDEDESTTDDDDDTDATN